MKTIGLASVFVTIAVAPVLAADARFVASLGRLDPQTRLEQICDYEAMDRIGHSGTGYHPDRAKSDVMTAPQHLGDLLVGTGAAFRSDGHWYQFSFKCRTARDHLKVLSFEYKVGAIIPETKWNSYGLWR
ncbi:DUF930 domain-containing protein [Bradyrhizobium canariense]|uniref:DUF930 domain-containing protein n=1 Tax=Bradyrhizobium canariense TaxID=255045 RepID=A0A1H1NVZ0_9BRAD|nr:DUF930 domain-containing protein [Bradyrhizobium canariense]SDS03151.1 protein of unknown function [Bradyrhizobium canariense]